MRLDKYLTKAGMGSRSQVKEYIRGGLVTVEGKTETDCGRHIEETACVVTCRGQTVGYQKTAYYMLNKPGGFVCATKDEKDRTVMELLADTGRDDLFPVGRLDKDTEGLLLITNDGELAHRLLSPARHVPKQYLAVLSGEPSPQQTAMLEHGVDIGEGTLTAPAVFAWKDRQRLEALLTVTEGKYHQVKRMFAAVGCRVLALRRLSMGTLLLDERLAPGAYRCLLHTEVDSLLAVTGLKEPAPGHKEEREHAAE